MNRQEQRHLLSQQAHLQGTLEQLPDDAFIMRHSSESRLRSIADRLAAAPHDEREPAKVRLIFDGMPVVGSHGVAAEFGSKAVQVFSDVIAMMAASIAGPRKSTGRMPSKDQHQLLITDIARGSFGFELEAVVTDQLAFDESSTVEQAIERVQALLRASVLADDEALAEAASGLDRRVIEKVRSFMDVLVENQAICAVSAGGDSFRFNDLAQIRQGLARLAQDSLMETEVVLEGILEGVLSKPRTFQMNFGGELGVITGKVLKFVDDLDGISRELIFQHVRVRLLKTQVGHGRPRYVLMDRPELTVSQG